MQEKIVIKVNKISKTYGQQKAVDQVSFVVEEGQVFGILGPNGSGKTTTLRIILGLIKNHEGSINIFNAPVEIVQHRIGAVLENTGFFPSFSASKNIRLMARAKGVSIQKADFVLEQMRLGNSKSKRYKNFSYGMKQRLAIAGSLLKDPDLIILDEPTNGLDPHGIIEIRELISALSKEGKTILLASHMLSEIEKICSHILIMHNGKIMKIAEKKQLIDEYKSLETAFISLTR